MKLSKEEFEALNPIVQILIKRDNMSLNDALNYMADAQREWKEITEEYGEFSYDDAVEFIEDWFGLEPDYLMDFLYY